MSNGVLRCFLFLVPYLIFKIITEIFLLAISRVKNFLSIFKNCLNFIFGFH
jgi:hypothetical protein